MFTIKITNFSFDSWTSKVLKIFFTEFTFSASRLSQQLLLTGYFNIVFVKVKNTQNKSSWINNNESNFEFDCLPKWSSYRHISSSSLHSTIKYKKLVFYWVELLRASTSKTYIAAFVSVMLRCFTAYHISKQRKFYMFCLYATDWRHYFPATCRE